MNTRTHAHAHAHTYTDAHRSTHTQFSSDEARTGERDRWEMEVEEGVVKRKERMGRARGEKARNEGRIRLAEEVDQLIEQTYRRRKEKRERKNPKLPPPPGKSEF
ncbi:hypothetical protein TWF730_009527 [Orbilia blumenaviensis]|uniref:Uncharacterized protein n=1 Tax=Orbilia blumenaviensis TaxID=1796055 RepID=A0AAV9UUJ7_9PEZI